MYFKVEYYAGPYSGTRTVQAECGADAKEKVKRMIRREMMLPMYADGYKVLEEYDDDDPRLND